MNYDATITCHEGNFGRATRLDLPDRPDAAETVCGWLTTAPAYHPLWTQYSLCAVRLRDNIPGFPAPVRKFVGATHEINLVALNPEHGPYKPETIWQGPLHFLLPVNIAEQFEATDDEAEQLTWFAAWGVVIGLLNPETADAPDRIRMQWLGVLTKTLAHIRGEEHAP
jgi:hypothetical protein